jgi:hypothetical protein
MISLVSNQALRGGEHIPQAWREMIGGAMVTLTIILPIVLLAFYHGKDEFLKRVDGAFDRVEFWMEKQIIRRLAVAERYLRSQKPLLPTSRPSFPRSQSAPQISMIEYLSAISSPSSLSKDSFRINVSPPRTPVYVSGGELNFKYNPKKEKEDV